MYKQAMNAAMRLFELSQNFPREETYSLTDQMRRSSRSVCANLAEAWRKRLYQPAFIAKISDCEGEAAETQTWIEFAFRCGYIDKAEAKSLRDEYESIIACLVTMRRNAKTWCLPKSPD